MATRQPKGDNIGFYLRIPAELKVQLEAKAKDQGCSVAQLICDLARQGLGIAPVPAAAAVFDATVDVNGDVDIDEWLDRNAG